MYVEAADIISGIWFGGREGDLELYVKRKNNNNNNSTDVKDSISAKRSYQK